MSLPLFHHDDADPEPTPQHVPDETVPFLLPHDQRQSGGPPNFARHLFRSETVTSRSSRTGRALLPRFLTTVYGSSGFVTCPPSCTKSTRFVRHCFRTSRSTHCLGGAMDPRERCPHTERTSDVREPQESDAAHGPSTMSPAPPTRRDKSSLPPLRSCPPRLYHALELGKFLDSGFGSLSPVCGVTALQTGEIHENSAGTRKQLMTSLVARQQPLQTLWGSHTQFGDVWLFVLTETLTERRLRYDEPLPMLRLVEVTLDIPMGAEDSATLSGWVADLFGH